MSAASELSAVVDKITKYKLNTISLIPRLAYKQKMFTVKPCIRIARLFLKMFSFNKLANA